MIFHYINLVYSAFQDVCRGIMLGYFAKSFPRKHAHPSLASACVCGTHYLLERSTFKDVALPTMKPNYGPARHPKCFLKSEARETTTFRERCAS